MEKEILIQNKIFVPFISRERIQEKVQEIVQKINQIHANDKTVFVCVLNGAFLFTADIFRKITIKDVSIAFLRLASYEGLKSRGEIKKIMGFSEDLRDKTVIIIEDIIESGTTMKNVIEEIQAQKPKSIKITTLLRKPECVKEKISVDYLGFDIGPGFVVGYGLDYDGVARNLPDIYVLKK